VADGVCEATAEAVEDGAAEAEGITVEVAGARVGEGKAVPEGIGVAARVSARVTAGRRGVASGAQADRINSTHRQGIKNLCIG